MTRRQWRYLTLSLWLLAIALAAWTLSQLPFGDILSRLGLLGPEDWTAWLLINIAILYLAVKRWQLLSRALASSLPLLTLFRLRQAGSAVSFLTPGPHFGGEPLQLYWLSRHCGLPLHRAVAMLGLDRFMETGTNIAVLLAGVLILLGTTILPLRDSLQISAILLAVLIAMMIAVAVMIRHPLWLAQRFRPLTQRWRGTDAPDESEGGWLALVDLLRKALSRQRPRLWLALLMSLAGWAALLIELVLLLHLLGVTPSWLDIVLIMAGMRLAMLLPVPGGIGTIEASLLWSFRLLGLPIGAAAGLIALIRLRDALVLLLGLGCLASFRRQARGPIHGAEGT
ncbi:MAG: lysylphosphatidylglycerol synthase transmembrane domain-containing protein [Pseudomonadota bacterium]